MKKNILALFIAAIFTIAVVMPVLAEEAVPPVPAQQFTEKELAAIKTTPERVAGMEKKLFGDKKNPGAISQIQAAADAAKTSADNAAAKSEVAANKAQEAANKANSLEGVVSSHTGAITSNTTAITNNTDAITKLRENLKNETNAIARMIFKNILLVCSLLVLGFLALGGYLFFIRKDIIKKDAVKEISGIKTDIQDGFDLILGELHEVKDSIVKIPVETAEAVHDFFNPKPFILAEDDKEKTIYEFPTEDKCYRTFKVVDTNGSTNPADFEQQIVGRGYDAKTFCIGMYKKFQAGKLVGTDEEKLIKHLIATGKIKISKK